MASNRLSIFLRREKSIVVAAMEEDDDDSAAASMMGPAAAIKAVRCTTLSGKSLSNAADRSSTV